MNPSDIQLDALGFPVPHTFEGPQLNTAPRRAPRVVFTIRFMLLAVAIAAAVMALVRAEFGASVSEVMAGWLAKHGEEKFIADDPDGALRDLDRAISWFDRTPEIFELRGQVRLEKGDRHGALADFNKAVDLAPKQVTGYVRRAQALQRLNDHEAAIRDSTRAIELYGGVHPMLLNSRAYTRAIAGRELEAALDDINAALKLEGEEAAYLDTRGYILSQLGKDREALDDLNRAIERESRNTPFRVLMTDDPRAQKIIGRLRRMHDHNLAVMYHHRGEVYQHLEEEDKALADLRRGDELGYNPEQGVY